MNNKVLVCIKFLSSGIVFLCLFFFTSTSVFATQRIDISVNKDDVRNLVHFKFKPDHAIKAEDEHRGGYNLYLEIDFLDDLDNIIFTYPKTEVLIMNKQSSDIAGDPDLGNDLIWHNSYLNYDLYISPPCLDNLNEITKMRIEHSGGNEASSDGVSFNYTSISDNNSGYVGVGVLNSYTINHPISFDPNISLSFFTKSVNTYQCNGFLFNTIVPYGGCPDYSGNTSFPYYDIEIKNNSNQSIISPLVINGTDYYDIIFPTTTIEIANQFPLSFQNVYTEFSEPFDITISDANGTIFTDTNIQPNSSLDFEFSDPSNMGTFYVYSDCKIQDRIKIHYGQTVIVNGATLEFMNESSGIIIDRGGTLILDNAVLSGKECFDNRKYIGYNWAGIQLKGDMNTFHPIDPLNNMHPHHGLLYALNGTKIKDAKQAIFVIDLVNLDDIGVDTDTNPDVDHGGGILKLDNVLFEDNIKCIEMYPINYFGGNVENSISNSKFVNYFTHTDSNENPISFTQISLIGTEDLKIEGCQFMDDVNHSWVNYKPITAIHIRNSKVQIGDENEEDKENEFLNLKKAIDIYETGGFDVLVHIYNNVFTGLDKAITLNTAKHTIIKDNEFSVSRGADPAYSSTAKDTYCIMAFESSGFEITKNTFKTSHNPINERGIVLVNTYDTNNDMAEINANTFIGNSTDGFISGIEFDGNNNSLQLRCNNFGSNSKHEADWRFVNNAQLETQGLNPTIGGDVGENYFNNTWGTNSTNNIFFDSVSPEQNSEITLYADVQASLPSRISGDGGNLSSVSQSIGLEFKCEDRYGLPLDNGGEPPISNCSSSGFILRTYQKQDNLNKIEEALLCEGSVKGIKSLVATYANKDDFFSARAQLDQLPLDTEENIEFYETFDAMLTTLENEGTAGKSAYALSKIKDCAGEPNPQARKGKIATYAESILAMKEGKTFERSAAALKSNSQYQKNLNGSLRLELVPNPATTKIRLNLSEAGSFKIYDLNGKLQWKQNLQEAVVLDVSHLSNGFYICEFTSQISGKIQTGKLLINH